MCLKLHCMGPIMRKVCFCFPLNFFRKCKTVLFRDKRPLCDVTEGTGCLSIIDMFIRKTAAMSCNEEKKNRGENGNNMRSVAVNCLISGCLPSW